MPLQRLGANEPARSRRLTPRGLWRRGSCGGPRYEIFTWGSEHRNGGRGPTAVDVRNALGARRAPRPAPLPLTMCPSSPQAIRAAGARADQVGDGEHPKRQAEEELDYAARSIDKTDGSLVLVEIKKGSLRLLEACAPRLQHVSAAVVRRALKLSLPTSWRTVVPPSASFTSWLAGYCAPWDSLVLPGRPFLAGFCVSALLQ